MASGKNERHRLNRIKAEKNLFATKASFVAAIVVTLTIFKDILSFIFTFNWVWGLVFFTLAFVPFVIIFLTNWFDEFMKKEATGEVGVYFTIISLVVFFIENTVMGCCYGVFDVFFCISLLVVAFGLSIWGAYKLLCTKI